MNGDLRLLNAAIAASTAATDDERKAAHRSALSLAGKPFVFNAHLLLAARGVRPTEANILTEAAKLAAANERHFTGLRAKRGQEGEAT